MTTQWLNFGILNASFLALFAVAEYLLIHRKWQVEHTRKLVHVGAGLLALTFPFAFEHWLPVALTTGGFAGLLWLTKKKGWLNAINGIQRRSHGSYLYPLTIMLCFLVAQHMREPLYYLMPMSLMAVGDPLACLVGKRWPVFSFSVPGGTKSVGGTLACFLSTTLLSGFLLYAFPMSFQYDTTVVAIALGATAAFSECISGKGLDNLTLPTAVMLAMYGMSLELLVA